MARKHGSTERTGFGGEVNKGIWRSKDGLLTENMDFVKKAPVKAVQMDEPTPWTRVIDGQTKELVARPNHGGSKTA